MNARICFSTALLVIAAGCSKKTSEQDVQPSAAVSGALAAPSVVSSSSVAAADEEDSDIELPEDFAEEATEDITAQNLDSQLAALEKEVDNDR